MKEIYLDPTRDIEERVEDLLKRMTVDEKINQMIETGINELEPLLEKAKKGEKIDIGASFVYYGFNVETYNELQRYQLENNRLKIPFILACENTHGVSNPLCTIFPTTGCISATFDEELAGKAAEASAKEARILGITQVYAPNIDISWEQRWGRVEENFGEDPYLTSRMGVAFVKNFQKEGVAATVKHYIAYGLGESGLNLAPAHIGEREVREYMLPPFEACVKEGKAWSLMPSYNEVDGEPVHSSKRWMRDVLREELGFDGMIVTDYGASNMLKGFHRIVEKPVEAGVILCDNEIDTEANSFFGYNDEFRQLVKDGKYPEEKIDACVRNILRLKFRLGLFENPFANIEKIPELHCEKHVSLAREIAEKGTVLLKNDGILPLKADKKIALIGPNADVSQLGNYIYYGYFDESYKGKCVAEESLSMRAVLEKANANFVYEKGSEFAKTDDELLERAYRAAKDSDVVILALGDNSKGGNCAGSQEDLKRLGATKVAVTSGEGYDLNSIELTGAQEELFEKVRLAGKPIIMLLYGGRPHAITRQVDDCSAILFAFGAGEQGNEAIYDILLGKVNPSGKLPLTFPRSTGHLPCFYNYKPSARGSFYQRPGTVDKPGNDYVFENPKALFPFGYGLSYTRFEYSNLNVKETGKYEYTVSVDVENVGEYDGDESVLCFLSAMVQRITPMVKKLRAFKRVSLKKGEKKTVELFLNKEDFTYIGLDMEKQTSTGKHIVRVGDLSAEIVVE